MFACVPMCYMYIYIYIYISFFFFLILTYHVGMRPCVCKGHGDPHYQLFDGQGISFAGICKYLMATPKVGSNLTDFKVEVKNEHRKNNMRVSFTRSVEVKFKKFSVKLMTQRKVMVSTKLWYLTLLRRLDLCFPTFSSLWPIFGVKNIRLT